LALVALQSTLPHRVFFIVYFFLGNLHHEMLKTLRGEAVSRNLAQRGNAILGPSFGRFKEVPIQTPLCNILFMLSRTKKLGGGESPGSSHASVILVHKWALSLTATPSDFITTSQIGRCKDAGTTFFRMVEGEAAFLTFAAARFALCRRDVLTLRTTWDKGASSNLYLGMLRQARS